MQKLRNIHSIPTDKPTHLFRRPSDSALIYEKSLLSSNDFFHLEGQHLYLTAPSKAIDAENGEEIKTGDYILRRTTQGHKLIHITAKEFTPFKFDEKVVATTDYKILLATREARIPNSLIEAFVASQGSLKSVLVEYEEDPTSRNLPKTKRIKLNPDGTVIWSMPKEDIIERLAKDFEDKHRKLIPKEESTPVVADEPLDRREPVYMVQNTKAGEYPHYTLNVQLFEDLDEAKEWCGGAAHLHIQTQWIVAKKPVSNNPVQETGNLEKAAVEWAGWE